MATCYMFFLFLLEDLVVTYSIQRDFASWVAVNYLDRVISPTKWTTTAKACQFHPLYRSSIGHWYELETWWNRIECSHQTVTSSHASTWNKKTSCKEGLDMIKQDETPLLHSQQLWSAWMAFTLHLMRNTLTVPCIKEWIWYGNLQGHCVGP